MEASKNVTVIYFFFFSLSNSSPSKQCFSTSLIELNGMLFIHPCLKTSMCASWHSASEGVKITKVACFHQCPLEKEPIDTCDYCCILRPGSEGWLYLLMLDKKVQMLVYTEKKHITCWGYGISRKSKFKLVLWKCVTSKWPSFFDSTFWFLHDNCSRIVNFYIIIEHKLHKVVSQTIRHVKGSPA